MPIRYVLLADPDLLYAEWTGVVTHEEWAETYRRYLSDPLYRPGRRELLNCSGLEDFAVDFSLVRGILGRINRDAALHGAAGRSTLWTPDAMVYGIGRMFQSLAENARGIEVVVFRDAAGALADCRLTHPDFDALRADPGLTWRDDVAVAPPLGDPHGAPPRQSP